MRLFEKTLEILGMAISLMVYAAVDGVSDAISNYELVVTSGTKNELGDGTVNDTRAWTRRYIARREA